MAKTTKPRKTKGKGKAKRAKVTKPRAPRRIAKTTNVNDYAGLSEMRTFTVSGGFNANQMYNLMNLTLEQFPRATGVAAQYQHYRIKYVKVSFKPQFDTFQPGQPFGKTYLYYMIDKAGAIPTNVTLEGIKNMGARPKTFDERFVSVGWRPSVLTDNLVNAAVIASQPSQYKISPWLSTSSTTVGQPWNASSVDHLGLYFYVEQVAGTALQYTVEVEAQFQFKKPLIADAVGQTPAIPVTPAVRNASKDGIVDSRAGGDDELLH